MNRVIICTHARDIDTLDISSRAHNWLRSRYAIGDWRCLERHDERLLECLDELQSDFNTVDCLWSAWFIDGNVYAIQKVDRSEIVDVPDTSLRWVTIVDGDM
jgi:hypothetical protein